MSDNVAPIAGWNISKTAGVDSVFAYIYNDPSNTGMYTLEITGAGAMKDLSSFDKNEFRADAYRTNITSVTIGLGVTSVGNHMFRNFSGLISVVIQDGVTYIGTYAFHSCSKLTNVVIPDSVTSIGNFAFQNCSVLTSFHIPDGVTSINNNVFLKCPELATFDVGVNNTAYCDIDGILFDKNATTLIAYPAAKEWMPYVIPKTIISIGDYAFMCCSRVTSITIPDGVISIGQSAFNECSWLINVIMPDSVTSIGKSAFAYCSGLTSIVIPDSVTSIGEYAFNKSGLTSITFKHKSGDTLSIGTAAFLADSSIDTTVYVPNVKNINTSITRYSWVSNKRSVTYALLDLDYIIKSSTLYTLADKVRTLSGTEETLTPTEMQNELETFNSDIGAIVSEQDSLIAQIVAALEAKFK